VKAKLDGAANRSTSCIRASKDAVTSILRTADYVWPFLFTGVRSIRHHLAAYNVLRILRGAGLGASTLDIAERMIEQARYNPLAGSAGREEARAPGTPLR